MRAFLIVAFVAACRPAVSAAPFTLRVAVSGPLDAVRPDQDLKGWASIALPLVFEPLVTVGAEGQIVPLLASKAELAGPHGMKIWPRKGARFSDGSEMTFADIAESVASSQLKATREGDHVLVASQNKGAPIELLLLRAYIYRRAGSRFLGTGAFVVDEEDFSRILLARVRPAPGFISRVRLDSYATPQDAFARTLKGDADMLPDVQDHWVEFFEGVPRLRILRARGPSANMVAFNLKRLSRLERISLVSALSSNEIRRLAFGDDCVPPSRRPELEPFPAGRPLDIIAVPVFDRFATAIRRALGARGGNIRTVEVRDYFAQIEKGDFDLATVRPRVWPPITAALSWRTGAATNWFGYSNAAVDSALDSGKWNDAERALEADPPGALICTPPALVVLDARIKNASLGNAFWESLPQWEVSQ